MLYCNANLLLHCTCIIFCLSLELKKVIIWSTTFHPWPISPSHSTKQLNRKWCRKTVWVITCEDLADSRCYPMRTVGRKIHMWTHSCRYQVILISSIYRGGAYTDKVRKERNKWRMSVNYYLKGVSSSKILYCENVI